MESKSNNVPIWCGKRAKIVTVPIFDARVQNYVGRSLRQQLQTATAALFHDHGDHMRKRKLQLCRNAQRTRELYVPPDHFWLLPTKRLVCFSYRWLLFAFVIKIIPLQTILFRINLPKNRLTKAIYKELSQISIQCSGCLHKSCVEIPWEFPNFLGIFIKNSK